MKDAPRRETRIHRSEHIWRDLSSTLALHALQRLAPDLALAFGFEDRAFMAAEFKCLLFLLQLEVVIVTPGVQLASFNGSFDRAARLRVVTAVAKPALVRQRRDLAEAEIDRFFRFP